MYLGYSDAELLCALGVCVFACVRVWSHAGFNASKRFFFVKQVCAPVRCL